MGSPAQLGSAVNTQTKPADTSTSQGKGPASTNMNAGSKGPSNNTYQPVGANNPPIPQPNNAPTIPPFNGGVNDTPPPMAKGPMPSYAVDAIPLSKGPTSPNVFPAAPNTQPVGPMGGNMDDNRNNPYKMDLNRYANGLQDQNTKNVHDYNRMLQGGNIAPGGPKKWYPGMYPSTQPQFGTNPYSPQTANVQGHPGHNPSSIASVEPNAINNALSNQGQFQGSGLPNLRG